MAPPASTQTSPRTSGPVPNLGPVMSAIIVMLAGALAAVAAHEPLGGLALGVVAVLAVAVMLDPHTATLIVIAVLYSNAAVVAVQLHDVPSIAATAVPVLLAVPLLHTLATRRQHIVLSSAVPYIVVYLAVQAVGALMSDDVTTSGGEVVTFLVEGIGLYLLVTNTVRGARQLWRVVWVLLAVGALLGALSVMQQVTGTFENDYFGFAQTSLAEVEASGKPDALPRLAGPIGEKNRYAQILVVLVPLGLVTLWHERRTGPRVAALVCTGLIMAGVSLTYSRGAGVGLAIALIVMVAMGYARPAHVVTVGVAVALVLLLFPTYRDRLSSLDTVRDAAAAEGSDGEADGSVRSRLTENIAAGMVMVDNPVIGVGPGQFPSEYPEYAERVGIRVKEGPRESHNLVLDIGAENGVVGLVAFGGAVITTMVQLLRTRRRTKQDNPDVAALATGFFVALVTYLATGLFLHLSFIRYFWLLLALAGVAATLGPHGPVASRAGRPRGARLTAV